MRITRMLFGIFKCIVTCALVGTAVMFAMIVPMRLFGYDDTGVNGVAAMAGIGASAITFVFTYPKGRSDLI